MGPKRGWPAQISAISEKRGFLLPLALRRPKPDRWRPIRGSGASLIDQVRARQ
ncbi:hypothetical protein NJD71_13655 [Psychrobacter sp. PP-21]|uniref:hypothetical protein n=1 Tax=Psychrobacter sp. PP-21 TaxID=2957503 RepID=UPI0029B1303C|nr:hypothetical protein [Psychrobacter sp. PP-21]MDX2375150.1 hypothetical protein [Psychrobacter sp. PP-21]